MKGFVRLYSWIDPPIYYFYFSLNVLTLHFCTDSCVSYCFHLRVHVRNPLIYFCFSPFPFVLNSIITIPSYLCSPKFEYDLAGLNPAIAGTDDAALLAAVLPPPTDEPAPLQRRRKYFRRRCRFTSGPRREEIQPTVVRAARQDGRRGHGGSSAGCQRRLPLCHTTSLQPSNSTCLAISCLVCFIRFFILIFVSYFFQQEVINQGTPWHITKYCD